MIFTEFEYSLLVSEARESTISWSRTSSVRSLLRMLVKGNVDAGYEGGESREISSTHAL